MRATSKARDVCARRHRSGRSWRSCHPCRTTGPGRTALLGAMRAARIAPPAGPDSTSRTGNRIAMSMVVRLPLDVISSIGHANPAVAEPLLEIDEIGLDDRADVRVGASRGKTIEFAYFGANFGRKRHRDVRHARRGCRDAAPVNRVRISLHESDRETRLSSRRSVGTRAASSRQYRAAGWTLRLALDALGNGETQPARHKRRRFLDRTSYCSKRFS